MPTGADVDRWKRQWETAGWCVAERLVPADVLAAARADLGQFFPSAEEFAADADPERNRPLRTESHAVMHRFPFESGALNRLVLARQPGRPGRGSARLDRPPSSTRGC